MTIQIVQVQSGFKADEKDSILSIRFWPSFFMVSFIGCSYALGVSFTICNFKKGSWIDINKMHCEIPVFIDIQESRYKTRY